MAYPRYRGPLSGRRPGGSVMFGRRTALSISFAAMAALASVLLLVVPTAGAASTSPTFTVDIAYDGTGQGGAAACPITGPGGDNTANDGVVCTNDDVAYG